MNFKYTALERDNSVMHGVVEAQNDRLVEEWLTGAGLRVMSIRPAPRSRVLQALMPQTSKVTRKDLILFSRQLATLLHTGIPMLMAIQLLRDQAPNRAFQAVLDRLIADLRGGLSLHAAMAMSPKTFPPMYLHLVEAGESSGRLETTLEHLSEYLKKEIELVQKVKKALTYPAIVLAVGAVVMVILITTVMPAMAGVLENFQADLPLLSRIIVNFSNFVERWRGPVLLALLILVGVALVSLRMPQGQKFIGHLLLRAPVVGRLTIARNLARFSRTAALLLNAGLPLPECLILGRDSASNIIFRQAMDRARELIVQGRSLAQALGAIDFVPGLYVQMVRVGEQSGALESNLTSMAEFYEKEVDDRVEALTSLLEPAITIGMGIAVGSMALAVLLPILDVLKAVGA